MYVFVSYAGKEEGAVWDLVTALDSAGHEPWIDQWTLSEPDWREQTLAILDLTKIVLIVADRVTLADQRRRWVWEQALAQETPVVIVRTDPGVTLPEGLRGFKAVDFVGGASARALGDLIAVVQRDSHSRSGLQREQRHPRAHALALTYRSAVIVAAALFTIAVGVLTGRAMGASDPIPPPNRTALAQAFSSIYRLGPAGIFLLTAVIFTLVRRQALLLVGMLVMLLTLAVGYIVSAGNDIFGLILAVALTVCGYLAGETQILLWPWLSYRLRQARRAFRPCLAEGHSLQECAAPVVRLLDYPIAIPLAGTIPAMQMLADAGLNVVQFGLHATNPRVQEHYQQFVHQISLEKLGQSATFEDALATIQAYQIIPVEARTQIKIFLQKREHCTNLIELIRAYGQFLWYLERPERAIPDDPAADLPGAARATRTLIRLAYKSIRYRDAAQYWMVYRWLESVVERIHALTQAAPDPAATTPRGRIRDRVQRLAETIAILRGFEEEMLRRFPAREQDLQLELAMIDISAGQLLSTEYQERQEYLTRQIEALKVLHRNQPASWLTIDKTATQVVEHNNPWCLLTLLLIEQFEAIQQLDVEYVNWAELQLTTLLAEVTSLKTLAQVEQQLVTLEIVGDSLGPLVDGTVRYLAEISVEAQSALDWPPGTYQYRQSLIDGQQKLDGMRAWLRARSSRARAHQWSNAVSAISTIMEQYLEEQRVVDTLTYTDPYMVGSPIPPRRAALFKGRMELAEQIVEWLRSDNRPTLVLHGARRMGKTSFLMQLQNLMSGWRDSPIPVFVDGQRPEIVKNDASFLWTLARAIFTQLQRHRFQVQRPDQAAFRASPFEAFSIWLEDEVVPAIGEDVRLLVTIDEFEKVGNAIRDGALSIHVLDFLRHTAQHSENLLFLFCGVETIESLGPNAASYFIGVQAIEISFLDRKAAEELIRNPTPEAEGVPRYSDAVVREILRLTHCQPYLIQAICSRIIARANKRRAASVTPALLREALPDVFGMGVAYFKNIWYDAGEDGQAILQALAEGPAALPPALAASPTCRALLTRHVISRGGEAPSLTYQIQIPLVQQWVADQVIPAGPDALLSPEQ